MTMFTRDSSYIFWVRRTAILYVFCCHVAFADDGDSGDGEYNRDPETPSTEAPPEAADTEPVDVDPREREADPKERSEDYYDDSNQ